MNKVSSGCQLFLILILVGFNNCTQSRFEAIKAQSLSSSLEKPAPLINAFVTDDASILPDQRATLSWSVTRPSSLTLNPGNIDVLRKTSLVVTPSVTTTYTLTATNTGGSVSKSVTIEVSTPPDPVPDVLPPSILSFSASPTSIGSGQSSVLNWTVSSNVTSLTLDGIDVLGASPVTVSPSVDTVYTLIAGNAQGSATQSITVTVSSVIPDALPTVPPGPLVGAIVDFTITQAIPGLETTESPISLAYLNPVPAGSLGQITSSGGHLYVGGKRIRLYGINMALGSLMPTKADAELIAARLKKEGFNAVRLFGFDSPLATANTFTVTYKQQGLLNTDQSLNTVALDYFDYFVFQLEQNGIYVSFPIHGGRAYIEANGLCLSGACEGVDNYLPDLILSQKNFATMFLNHVNPYTKKAYKDDPGMFAIEINNENSLSRRWSNNTLDQYANDSTRYDRFIKPLRDMFANWAQTKYGTIGSVNTAWAQTNGSFADIKIPLMANSSTISTKLFRDWMDFMGVTETSYWSEMYDHLKKTVAVKCLVYGTQNHYSLPYVRKNMDLNDFHSYYGVQGAPNGQTNPSNGRPVFSGFTNASVLSATDIWKATAVSINEGKEIDKPNIITETAYNDYNQYLAEFEPLLTSYSGFQDIDALFLFNYHGMNLNNLVVTYSGWFNMTVNSVTRVSSALSFRRGDVTPGAPFVLKKTRDSYLDIMAAKKTTYASNYWYGGDIRAPYTKNMYMQIVNTAAEESGTFMVDKPDAAGTYTTTSGQIKWTLLNRIVVDTPRTKTSIGYYNNNSVSLGNGIDVTFGSTMNKFAVVSLTTLNDAEVLPSKKMLLTLAGYFTVPGEWPREPGQLTASWGTGTPRIEGVASTVRIQTTNNYKITALNSAGKGVFNVPVTKTSTYIEFPTSPAYKTGWYLIEAQ